MSDDLQSAIYPVHELARALRACADLVAGDGAGSTNEFPASMSMLLQEDAICLFAVLSAAAQRAHDELEQKARQLSEMRRAAQP